MVRRILPGGPAADAGIEPLERLVGEVFRGGIIRDFERADIVMSINGQRMRTVDDVEDAVSAARHGQVLTIVLRRGGSNEQERSITLKPVLQ
jgi:S1-C subfamily serine protease